MMLRSLLLVSPDSDRSLDQAAQSGADGLIVDVAEAGTEALRRTAGFLQAARPGAVFVRVGPLAARHTMAVLDALVPVRPTGIALAAAEGGADVTRLSALLRPREAIAGIDDGATRIIALATDTPAGLLALATYRDASRRLMALAWDDRPLAEALGAEDIDGVALAARSATLVAAAAAGVVALDRPFRGSDLAALQAEAEAAGRAGFSGKLALAADQIAVINAAFKPKAGTSR
jgi:citrate lyase subunit beta/citryl-CoA lyase